MAEEMNPMSNRLSSRAACLAFELALADYLEGEDRPAVPAHAQECVDCRVVLADLEQIRLASRDLVLADPPAVVWANVRARLAAEGVIRDSARPLSWLGGFGLSRLLPNPAALAGLAGLVLFGAYLTVNSRSVDSNLTARRPAAPAFQTVAAAPSVDYNLVRTVEEMEKSFKARERTLDPSVKIVYTHSLESLDTSIDECQDSVQREPSNDLAHEYLLAAYTQKAEVLASALQFEGR